MRTKILVVEDSATDRLIIQRMLSDYNVVIARDGIEAVRQVKEHGDIDLVILDLKMPGMDGFEVLKELGPC
ncbi:MAG: response regulator, partial [Bacillota bacterium]